MKILMAGRANGLQVIDGPYVRVRDSEGFRDFCTRTQILGYDGKWALHPDQVTILNEVFSPTQETNRWCEPGMIISGPLCGVLGVRLIEQLTMRMAGMPSSTCQVSKSECQ